MVVNFDSTNKCNKTVKKDLVWGSEVKNLAWSVVEAIRDVADRLGGNDCEVGSLWEVLPDKAVGILVGAPLPGRVRIGEKKVGIESTRDTLVMHELNAVVAGDGEHLVFDRQHRRADGFSHRGGGLCLDLVEQAIAGSSFDQRENTSFTLAADDRIGLPVAYS